MFMGKAVFTKFEDLNDRARFVEIVKNHLLNGWPESYDASKCKVTVDDKRIDLAYSTYALSLETYTVALQSQNPDQYKRAAALLHAIYETKPIVKIEWDHDKEYYRDFSNVGVSYGDSQHWENYFTWFEEYSNYAVGFDLAFRCCSVYEDEQKVYSTDYLDNMCYYMATNSSISVASFVMIFKSFMQ